MGKAFTCKQNYARNLKSFLFGMNEYDNKTLSAKGATSCMTVKLGLRINNMSVGNIENKNS